MVCERKKIKVLHLVASPAIGGAEKVILSLTRNLNRERFDVVIGISILSKEKSNVFWEEAAGAGIEAVLEPIRIQHRYSITQLIDLIRIIRKHRPHIIHTHGFKTHFFGIIAAKIFKISSVATVHGMYSNRPKASLLFTTRYFVLRKFRKIIAVSDEINNILVKMGISYSRIVTIRNVPFIREMRIESNNSSLRKEKCISAKTKIVGFVGRLEHVKGCSQFVKAAYKVLPHFSDLNFVIFGDGSKKNKLEEEVTSRGYEKKIIFYGFRKKTEKIFNTLDCFVLPSLNEGIPLALLEAMYYGVPVIATCVGGVPEVIKDHESGILVHPNNVDELAKAMIETLRNFDAAKKRALVAKETISNNYSIEKWINNIENLYKELSGVIHKK